MTNNNTDLWDTRDTGYPMHLPEPVPSHEWWGAPKGGGKVQVAGGGFEGEEDEVSARKEHVNPGVDMPLCGSLETVLTEFGYGYYVYFDLIRVLLALSILLFIFQLIPYLWYVTNENPGFDEKDKTNAGSSNRTGYKDFFISEYTSDQRGAWYAANILCIVVSVIAFIYLRFRIKKKRDQCIEDGVIPPDAMERENEDRILRYKLENGSTVEDKVTDWDMLTITGRFILAAATFSVMITTTILVSYYSTRAADNDEDQTSTTVVSALLSILIQLLNAVYLLASYQTTMMLPIVTWTTFTKVYIGKIVLFRVAQTIALFATKSYKGHCAYYLIGEQFFFLMLSDLTLGNILEVVLPWVAAYFKRVIYRNTELLVGYTEADLLPRFDIAVEYLELFGRQYTLYMAMIVFPLASFLNILGLLLDYWIDKWRLMRISAKQRSRLLKTQRKFLSSVLLLSIVLSLVTPVAGVIFVLGGVTADACSDCDKCSFP